MNYLGPTSRPRLNEAVAVVFLFAGLFFLISLVSYNPFDPSWNTATAAAKPLNLMGRTGAALSRFLVTGVRIRGLCDPGFNSAAGVELGAFGPCPHALGEARRISVADGCLLRRLRVWQSLAPIADSLPAGGVVGSILADGLVGVMNLTGAAMFTGVCWILGLYLVSTFEMSKLAKWFGTPASFLDAR